MNKPYAICITVIEQKGVVQVWNDIETKKLWDKLLDIVVTAVVMAGTRVMIGLREHEPIQLDPIRTFDVDILAGMVAIQEIHDQLMELDFDAEQLFLIEETSIRGHKTSYRQLLTRNAYNKIVDSQTFFADDSQRSFSRHH